MSNASEIMQAREQRAAQRAEALDRAEYVLSRLDATTYNAAIAVDASRPLTGQLAGTEHVARALLDVMQELRKATASSEQDAETPARDVPDDDSDATLAEKYRTLRAYCDRPKPWEGTVDLVFELRLPGQQIQRFWHVDALVRALRNA